MGGGCSGAGNGRACLTARSPPPHPTHTRVQQPLRRRVNHFLLLCQSLASAAFALPALPAVVRGPCPPPSGPAATEQRQTGGILMCGPPNPRACPRLQARLLVWVLWEAPGSLGLGEGGVGGAPGRGGAEAGGGGGSCTAYPAWLAALYFALFAGAEGTFTPSRPQSARCASHRVCEVAVGCVPALVRSFFRSRGDDCPDVPGAHRPVRGAVARVAAGPGALAPAPSPSPNPRQRRAPPVWSARPESCGAAAARSAWRGRALTPLHPLRFAPAAPPTRTGQHGRIPWGKVAAALLVSNALLPLCALRVVASPDVVWAGVRYRKRRGRVTRL